MKNRRALQDRLSGSKLICKECGAVYVGTTSRTINQRFSEHVKCPPAHSI